eukprot:scaffold7559_cov248-Pinguiococcus_pyrenoidosus.AAC.1
MPWPRTWTNTVMSMLATSPRCAATCGASRPLESIPSECGHSSYTRVTKVYRGRRVFRGRHKPGALAGCLCVKHDARHFDGNLIVKLHDISHIFTISALDEGHEHGLKVLVQAYRQQRQRPMQRYPNGSPNVLVGGKGEKTTDHGIDHSENAALDHGNVQSLEGLHRASDARQRLHVVADLTRVRPVSRQRRYVIGQGNRGPLQEVPRPGGLLDIGEKNPKRTVQMQRVLQVKSPRLR